MTREEKFTFRLDAEDRRRLVEIARRLERSQADALRRLIRQAYRELADNPAIALGWDLVEERQVRAPAYDGPTAMTYAHVVSSSG